MASAVHELFRRFIDCDDDRFDGFSNCDSGWNRWGRWVLLGVLIVAFVVFMVLLSILSRRRRRRGMQPYYGTGWLAGGSYPMNNYNGQPPYGGQQNYQGEQGGYYNPPPAYGQVQPQYEQQNTGVQEPSHVYNRDNTYAAPPGAPPPKK